MALWERWRDRRDAQAFHELVARYAGMVYATCRRILGNPEDAEDATQDCFLRLAASDRRIDISTSLAGWLHRAAHNRALIVLRSEVRRRRRERRVPARDGAAGEPGWEEIRGLVDRAIEHLPGDLRAVIVGHFLERATLDSLAGRLGISRRQVEYRIAKGIEAIRARLRKRGVKIGAALALLLSSNLAEAAPPALLASLGKLALAGTPGPAFSMTGAGSSACLHGGLLLMKKWLVASILIVLLLTVWMASSWLRPGGRAGGGGQVAPGVARESPAPAKPSRHRPPGPRAADDPSPVVPGRDPAREGSVSGVVRVQGTERPAPGVIVVVRDERTRREDGLSDRLHAPAIEDADLFARAGDDGRYRIEKIRPGDYRMFAVGGETCFQPIPPDRGVSFSIGPDRADAAIDVEVRPGGTLRGKVFDAEGTPVEGAKVWAPSRGYLSSALSQDAAFLGVVETWSKAGGAYRIAGLPLDVEYVLMARKEQARARPIEVLFTEEVAEFEVDVVLLPGSAVSGTVSGGGGAVPPNVEVRLEPEVRDDGGLELAKSTRTAADGLFRFEGVPAGRYRVGAGPGDPKGVAWAAVECDGLSDVTGIVLRIEAPAAPRVGRIAGRVIDDAGAPVPDARISISGFSSRQTSFRAKSVAGKDGSFSFEDVPYGVYNLTAEVAWHVPFLQPGVGLDDGPREVVLVRTAKSIRGRVVERGEGRPVAGAAVRLVPVGGDPTVMRILTGRLPDGPRRAKTGADGAFAFGDAPAGRIRVRADAPGLAFGWSREVTVDPGGEIDGVDVALSAGGTIEGLVLGPDGKPVADATVRAREPAGKTFVEQLRRILSPPLVGEKDPSAETDASGAFRLSRLPEGTFLLAAAHPAYAPSADAEVALSLDGKAEDVRIRLRRPASLRVRVIDRDEPRAGLMVQAIGDGPMKMQATDAGGRVEFTGLAPGHYLVQVVEMEKLMAGHMFGAKQKVAAIQEGRTEEILVSLGKGASVRGRVIGDLPRPIGTVVIHPPDAPRSEDIDLDDFRAVLLAAGRNEGTALIDADGTFSIADVPDGDWILEIPRMPLDPTKWAGLAPEERRSYYRATIRVAGGRDVTVADIRLGEAPGEAGGAPGRESGE